MRTFLRNNILLIKHCKKFLQLYQNEYWEKKNIENCLNDGQLRRSWSLRICRLVIKFHKVDMGFYRVDKLVILRNKNGKETHLKLEKI